MIIIDTVLDEISSLTGEKITESIKNAKLKAFMEELKEAIQEEYTAKYESEAYFSDLNNFLADNQFFNKATRVMLSKAAKKSLNALCNENAEMFVNEHKRYSPYETQIKKILCQLCDKIEHAILQCEYISTEDRAYSRQQEQSNHILENTEQIMQTLTIMAFNLKKTDNENGRVFKSERDDDKELYAVYTDDKISAFEKEIKYIEWIHSHENMKEGFVYLAQGCCELNELERAEQYYKWIISRYAKEEYELCNNLGLIYVKQNRYDEAILQYKEALKYSPENLNALYNLAVAYYDINEPEQSIAYIQTAMRIYPNDSDSISFYASLLMEASECDFDMVVELLTNALRNDPDDFYLNINLGYAYLFQKKFEMGIRLLERLYEKNPDEVLCIALLGMTYAMLGVENAEKAIPLFEKAYNITHEEGYRENIRHLKAGRFFDSVFYNGKPRNVYSDAELIAYYKEKGIDYLYI